MIDIKVPAVGESINEVTLIKWVKQEGEYVERDEVIAELESEKATFEVNAEKAGVLHHVVALDETIAVGTIMATIDDTAIKPNIAISTPSEAKQTNKGIIDLLVPTVGESINEVTLIKWLKKEGEYVHRDEPIAELESEKATFELNAEEAGVLMPLAAIDDVLFIGQLVAKIDTNAPAPAINPEAPITPLPTIADTAAPTVKATPIATAIMEDKKVKREEIQATGYGGKILKEDVLQALQNKGRKAFPHQVFNTRNVRNEKMSNLRKTISRRLVEAKNTTAMLTTFNEVDMSKILSIRKQYKDKFKETHGVNLGFMSFFSKACAIALSEYPAVNASVNDTEIVYHDYADISIAVSTPKGLTVPVLRNVESKSLAEIEKDVITLASKARENKLSMEDLQGGTFTITNGGVFGSLLSTPIINLPQSAILGMHKIQERPIAENGQVVIKPMMYIALSYDHRIIDGRESVGFLVRVKELLENPQQLLFTQDPIKALLEL